MNHQDSPTWNKTHLGKIPRSRNKFLRFYVKSLFKPYGLLPCNPGWNQAAISTYFCFTFSSTRCKNVPSRSRQALILLLSASYESKELLSKVQPLSFCCFHLSHGHLEMDTIIASKYLRPIRRVFDQPASTNFGHLNSKHGRG